MDNFIQAVEKANCFPVVCRMLIRLSPILTLTFLFSALLRVHRHLTMQAYRYTFRSFLVSTSCT